MMEDRRQRTDDGCQMTDDGEQMTDVRRQKSEVGRQRTEAFEFGRGEAEEKPKLLVNGYQLLV